MSNIFDPNRDRLSPRVKVAIHRYECRERHAVHLHDGSPPPPPEHCPFCSSSSPVTVERVDDEREGREKALFRGDCRACNKHFDVGAESRLLRRFRNDEEPTSEQLASAAWRIADHVDGGPERRKRRRDVEVYVARIKRYVRLGMSRAGCPHALGDPEPIVEDDQPR